MKKKITLSSQEIKQCRIFARDAAATQQPIEFGEQDTAQRSLAESARDILIGKLAETAVSKMLNSEYGAETEVNFDIYPRGIWDENDIVCNGWSIDVKSTRAGRWLLIEWNKLNFRSEAGDLPDFFIPCRTEWDMDTDEPGKHVEIQGYVRTEDILRGGSNILTLKKGDVIPGTSTVLQADNYGILFSDLNGDWDAFADILKSPNPNSQAHTEDPANTGPLNWSDAISGEPQTELLAKYSLLTNDQNILGNLQTVNNILLNGIKLFAFCTKEKAVRLSDQYSRFAQAGLLRLFVPAKMLPALTIIDGKADLCRKELKKLADQTPEFNYEQYIIEHAPAEQSLIIEAGAGTGKTTVMIDRILFLIHTVPDLSFEEIAMITFTNEATQNMLHKIEDALTSRYNAVESARYVQFLEDASKIRVSTIHSFSKELISELGSAIGYGNTFRIKSFKLEKRQLIDDYLNTCYTKKTGMHVDEAVGATMHEMEDLILDFWNKLDNIGLSEAQTSLDWGSCDDPNSAALHSTLKNAFTVLFKKYQELKLEADAIAVEDITRELKNLFSSGLAAQKNKPLKYLFIDEFQDTDDSQIAAAAWLTEAFNLSLFAVGDVKQSIYRFRGADETAFEHLTETLKREAGIEPARYSLVRNYRSSKDILHRLDPIFTKLERKGLLKYDGCLIPQKLFQGKINIKQITKKTAVKFLLPDLLRDAVKDCEAHAIGNANETQHVTVLARANYQIQQVGEICRAEKIPCYIRREGTFFTSQAVIDFVTMLRAFLFPNLSEALYNYLDTPFAAGTADPNAVSNYPPGSKIQSDYIKRQLQSSGFNRHLKDFRIRPVLAVLREILDDDQILARYYAERSAELSQWAEADRAEQLQVDCAQYLANLDHLFSLLRERFSGEMISLEGIFDYLTLSIQTNRSEDEPDISGFSGSSCVYGMTVHKAKGLEFDTVILPFTDKVFRRDTDTEILAAPDIRGKKAKIGWCRTVWSDIYKTAAESVQCNNYYSLLSQDETEASDREEARLLYVALTRAIRRIDIFVSRDPKPHTWGSFLEE